MAGPVVVVTGGTGNVGSAVVRRLAGDPAVGAVVGLARREPGWRPQGVRWVAADLVTADLRPVLTGAGAVVHAAWDLFAGDAPARTGTTNLTGTRRLLAAARDAGVATLVALSSSVVYAPGDGPVAESGPLRTTHRAAYVREKLLLERAVARVGTAGDAREVRLRCGLVAQRAGGAAMRRFYGFRWPLPPGPGLRALSLPVVPLPAGMRLQAVHADDVAAAVALALADDRAAGAYNLAAEPLLDVAALGRLFGARVLEVPHGLMRAVVGAGRRAGLHPLDPRWVDLLWDAPPMATRRAREELGWEPAHTADAALTEVFEGFVAGSGMDTPPLRPSRPRAPS